MLCTQGFLCELAIQHTHTADDQRKGGGAKLCARVAFLSCSTVTKQQVREQVMSQGRRGVVLLPPLIFLGLLLAPVCVCAPPNVLFILADDMGIWAARLAGVF